MSPERNGEESRREPVMGTAVRKRRGGAQTKVAGVCRGCGVPREAEEMESNGGDMCDGCVEFQSAYSDGVEADVDADADADRAEPEATPEPEPVCEREPRAARAERAAGDTSLGAVAKARNAQRMAEMIKGQLSWVPMWALRKSVSALRPFWKSGRFGDGAAAVAASFWWKDYAGEEDKQAERRQRAEEVLRDVAHGLVAPPPRRPRVAAARKAASERAAEQGPERRVSGPLQEAIEVAAGRLPQLGEFEVRTGLLAAREHWENHGFTAVGVAAAARVWFDVDAYDERAAAILTRVVEALQQR